MVDAGESSWKSNGRKRGAAGKGSRFDVGDPIWNVDGHGGGAIIVDVSDPIVNVDGRQRRAAAKGRAADGCESGWKSNGRKRDAAGKCGRFDVGDTIWNVDGHEGSAIEKRANPDGREPG